MEVVRLLGFGAPLLDIIVDGSRELLDRYELKLNGEVQATGNLLSIFQDVAKSHKDSIQYRPGGATFNTLRIAQWCLGPPSCTAVLGSLKNDDLGQTLRQEIKSAGVMGYFQEKTTQPTGTCLVICTENNRSLITHSGAATLFTIDFFSNPEIQNIIQQSQYFYCSAYSLLGCPEGVFFLASHASQNPGKIFALNLAAMFVCHQFSDQLRQLLPYVDVLFGNEAEADEFAERCGFLSKSREEFALYLSQYSRVGLSRYSRSVVITQGDKPAILAVDGHVSDFPPVPIPPEEIVDTNGAGDAFAGGFLASLMKKESPQQAMTGGHFAASVVLKHRGCCVQSSTVKSLPVQDN